jgi:hypothetical protein
MLTRIGNLRRSWRLALLGAALVALPLSASAHQA